MSCVWVRAGMRILFASQRCDTGQRKIAIIFCRRAERGNTPAASSADTPAPSLLSLSLPLSLGCYCLSPPSLSEKKLLDPMRSSGILCRAVGYLPRRGRQACALYTTGFTELGVACAARLASAEVGAIPSTAGSVLPASRAVNARRPLWCGPTARPWDPLSCLWSPCRPGRGAGRIS